MTEASPQTLAPTKPSSPARWLGLLAAPELMVAILLLVAIAICAATLPTFRDADYLLSKKVPLYIEVGMMALGLSFVIIGGHIDLSCASAMALVGTVVTTLYAHGIPFGALLVLTPLLGLLLGAVNGVIVAKLGLPSLVVTLATMAVYRGLAQVLVGDHALPIAPWFQHLDQLFIGDTSITVPLVIFLCFAIGLGLVLHRTVYGRWVFAMGTNSEAALYAGVPVAKVTIGFFMLSGLLSSLASLIMMSRLGIAKYDDANGKELDVITAVVLGGASIFGGRGTMFGTVMAIMLVAVMQTGMGLANIKDEYQIAANGGLLIFAVLASNGLAWLRKK
jgi:rhamnose transport system permease protein